MIDQADIIVIQRFYPRKGTIPYIEKMLSSGKPVIYEVDDLLTDLPEGHNLKFWAGETAELLPWLLPRVTAITVSTPLLAKAFSSFNSVVHVIPNLADTELFHPAAARKEGPVVIGFSGTTTHARDLEQIGEALYRVADRYGNNVAFSFLGYSTTKFSSLPGFRFIDFQRKYASFGTTLSSSGIDIAIVPLQDNRFNRCKSNIKWLEYSACGIAGIYADLPPYNTSVEHGTSGVLVDGDPDTWFRAICLLVDHPDLRNRIAQQAKREVLSKHSLKGGANALYTLYESIASNNCCTKIA
jgi:glycosyltransferase involved in cell wall biosynthesis